MCGFYCYPLGFYKPWEQGHYPLESETGVQRGQETEWITQPGSD